MNHAYVLNPEYALRSWKDHSRCLIRRRSEMIRKLSPQEFFLLLLCNGCRPIEEFDLLTGFCREGIILPCEPGQRQLTEWQKHRVYSNRCFYSIYWLITEKCNYNCLHCFNASDNHRIHSEFSYEEALKLLDEAEACGIRSFTITGGEPMMHPQFMEIMREIYRRDFYVKILNTNGRFLTKEILEEFRRIGANPTIKISFDGLGSHDWMRDCKGAEETTLNAIRMCVEAGFETRVQYNVNSKTQEALEATVDLLDELGVSVVRVIRTSESARWVLTGLQEQWPPEKHMERMLQFAKNFIQKPHKIEVQLWQLMDLYPQNQAYWIRPLACHADEFKETIPVCGDNRRDVTVAADGELSFCRGAIGTYPVKLGNVKQDGLQKHLTEGKFVDHVCRSIGEMAKANGKCENCRFFHQCLGGCRAMAYALEKDIDGVDPIRCYFFTHGYYEKIRELMGDWHCSIDLEV